MADREQKPVAVILTFEQDDVLETYGGVAAFPNDEAAAEWLVAHDLELGEKVTTWVYDPSDPPSWRSLGSISAPRPGPRKPSRPSPMVGA